MRGSAGQGAIWNSPRPRRGRFLRTRARSSRWERVLADGLCAIPCSRPPQLHRRLRGQLPAPHGGGCPHVCRPLQDAEHGWRPPPHALVQGPRSDYVNPTCPPHPVFRARARSQTKRLKEPRSDLAISLIFFLLVGTVVIYQNKTLHLSGSWPLPLAPLFSPTSTHVAVESLLSLSP